MVILDDFLKFVIPIVNSSNVIVCDIQGHTYYFLNWLFAQGLYLLYKIHALKK